jgi:two-component system response regulator FixJ
MSERNETGTVYVVDDDPSICELVEAIVVGAGFKAKCFPSADEFLKAVLSPTPGCVLLDLEMPGTSGLEFLERQGGGGGGEHEKMPVIILTAHGDVRTAVKSLKLGAADFLEKPFEKEALIGHVTIAIDADRKRRQSSQSRQEVANRLATLSPRERELLAAVIEGKSTKMIADSLRISARTVDHHRANLMEKMHAANVADLVRMALEAGFAVKKDKAD